MKFLPVLKWMINISLFAALAAGGAVVYFWKNSDELVQTELLKKFAEVAPDLELKIGATVLHGTEAVTLADIRIVERETSRELFRAKQLRVDVDPVQLSEHWHVVVDRIQLKSADILLTRLENGQWNWQQYRFLPPKTKAPGLPAVEVEDLRIQLTLKHGNNIPTARLLLTSPRAQAIPTSQHSYDFDGGVTLPGAGLLQLGGLCDLESGEWKIGGRLRDVLARQDLMNLALAANPQLQNKLEQLDTVIDSSIPHQPIPTQRSADAALLIGNNSQSAPRFRGHLDVDFNAGSSTGSAIPSFQLRVAVRNGHISSPTFPIQFSDVEAVFYKDNDNLEFQLKKAKGEGAEISGDFLISSAPGSEPPRASFKVERFPISKKLRPLMDDKVKRIFDAFQPAGAVSAKGTIVQQPDGTWQPQNVTAQVHDGTVLYHKFRYPVTQLTGTIVQRPFRPQPAAEAEPALSIRDVMMDVQLTGMVGKHAASTAGWWKNPGPEAEMRFEVTASTFPLDHHFRNALEEKHQRVVDSLALTGKANARLVFYRPPGLNKRTQPYFDVRVFDAKMRFQKFPYDIDNLSGHLTFNGPAKHWTFHELKGSHGKGQLHATGNFRGAPSPGVLDLTINAKGAALDSDLYNALSKTHRKLWNMVNPDGFCDLTTHIHWTAVAGRSALVSFPETTPVRIYNTRIRPTPFPFDMYVKEATLSYDPNDPRNAGVQHCEIHSFNAVHDSAPLSASNSWIEGKPNGEWQIHLNEVNAANLKPDDRLRAALPESWHETLNKIHQTGTVAIQNSEMDFRGDIAGQRNTTARWNLNLGFRDCTITAGLDVSHIFGRVTAEGVWDGFRMKNSGTIQLETAEVLEMPFTNIRGPYTLNDEELVLGARQVFEASRPLAEVNRQDRVKCQAYGGELLFDALVEMSDDGQYQFFTELANARLESYAALHIPEQRNLKGVVTAWMSLGGHGDDPGNLSGRGQLRISPAALYELPVMVKLLGSLSQLNLNVQNLTAFNYALLNFTVRDEAFWLNPVDLVGESISFRGQGSVGFGGAVDLDFYSRPARTRTVALPIISGLFTNWAKIEVRGTTDRPQTRAAPLGQLDEGMKQFLQPFNPNPAGPIPGLVVPRVFQQPQPLLMHRRQQQSARQ